MNFSSLNFSSLKAFDDDFSKVEYFSRQQNIFRAPKNREASISLYRCRVNAKDMLLAKKKQRAEKCFAGAKNSTLKISTLEKSSSKTRQERHRYEDRLDAAKLQLAHAAGGKDKADWLS